MDGIGELARRWVDSGTPAPAEVVADAGRVLGLAWAIKDLCYAAWSSEPQAAGRASQALGELRSLAGRTPLPDDLQAEIEALDDWTRAIAHLANGAMAEAAIELDAAAALFRRLGRASDAAQTQVPRIMALSMLGRHDEAVDCAEAAQRSFVALGDRRAAAKVSLNLGSLHLRHDAYVEAARHYREATVLFARIADREHSVMADIGVGDALTAQGDFVEAARVYARARMRSETHGLPVLQALADESMALLDLARGRFGAALAGFESSRRRYEVLGMPQHLAIAEKQLADAYLELHLLPEALALYEPTLARFRTLDMPDDEAWTLAQRGRAQALLGERAAAAASLRQAGALFDAQASPVGQSAVMLARAELALAEGDGAGARALAEEAAAGFEAAGLAGGRARAELTRAEGLLCEGRPAAARTEFDRLLAEARASETLSLQVRCLTGQGRAALALGDEAAARPAFQAAVDLFEAQRRALPGDDIRSAFLIDHLRPYESLLCLAVQDHARRPGAELAAEVLRWLDRCRARGLSERLAQGGGDGSSDAPAPESASAAAALRTRLNWLTRRLQRHHDEGESPAALEHALRRTEHELLEVARRDRLARPVARVGSADEVDIVRVLPDLLEQADALIEFGVAGDFFFACVVRVGGIEVRHLLAPRADVLEAASAARFQIETLRHGSASLGPHLARLSQRAQVHMERLHALLWAPLAAHLVDCRRVLVVAPAPLAALPFAALHDGRQPLGERHELAFAPSAQWACAALARHPAPFRTAVAVGEGSRLPHARAEAEAVAERFGPAAALLVGANASLEALQRHAPGAQVLHLACHAEFRRDNPMFSALHLHDEALTVERVEGLALPPGLVVLSACETGLGDASPGDEHVGLVRAFFVAGAARVLASLWPVDDAVTALFMDHFYGALQGGATAAAALRRAQTGVREIHPHPAFWAAFALYGGW